MDFLFIDFTGTTKHRTLTFGTNIRYGKLYCLRVFHLLLITPFVCPFFLYFIQSFRPNQLSIYEYLSLNFINIMRTINYILLYKAKVPDLFFCLLFLFSPFLSLLLQCNQNGNFRQRFHRNYNTMYLEIWYNHRV